MAVFARGILLPRCPWAFLSSARDFTSRCYKIGDEAEIRRVISIEDVQAFAHFTGDTNPIHLDENFAKKTRFGAVIVHGVILNGYVGSPVVEEFALACTVVFVWTVHQTSVALCFNNVQGFTQPNTLNMACMYMYKLSKEEKAKTKN